MQILIITNSIHGKVNPTLNNLLGAAKTLGAKSDVLIVGHQLSALSQQIAAFAQVKQVLALDNPGLANLLAENIAPQLAKLAINYTHVLVAADSFGKNLLPRIAGILEIGQISEIFRI